MSRSFFFKVVPLMVQCLVRTPEHLVPGRPQTGITRLGAEQVFGLRSPWSTSRAPPSDQPPMGRDDNHRSSLIHMCELPFSLLQPSRSGS